MAEPTARQSHIDTALTNVSIAYRNAEYIHPQVFPVIPVAKQTNKFFKFPKGAWYRDETGVRAPGTRAKRAEYTLSTDNYLCEEKALSKGVPDEVIENSDDPLTPMVRATEFVADQVLKSIEIDVLDLVFGTGWSSSATPSPTWDDDTSDPLGDIETGINTVELAIGRAVNTAIIGRGLWRYLKNHPDVVDRLKYGQTSGGPAIVSLQGVASLIGVDRVLLTRAVKNTGNEGASDSMSYIGGNHMVLMYVSPTPALDVPSAGYVFQWKTREVNRYREDQEHQSVVECRASWDSKVTASDAGYLIKSGA